MKTSSAPRGFLIELLVVVTIITLLLALLMPALDKAVYQAELAVCASHLRVVGAGVVTYAYSSRKKYPVRLSRTANGSNRPCDMYWGSNNVSKKDDLPCTSDGATASWLPVRGNCSSLATG